MRDLWISCVKGSMNEKEFEELVGKLQRSPIPSSPGNLDQNVLRRIRLARAENRSTGSWLSNWLPRPAFMLATITVVMGTSFATAAVLAQANQPSRADSARVALGFDSFADPLSLPTDHHP